MKEFKIKVNTPEEMIELGRKIGRLCYPNIVLAMNGNLGAGKTTMTKGIGEVLNIKRVINSPTFTIMKVYEGTLNLYHLDVYRVENVNNDFELEEYFYYGGVTVIEWADNIKPLLPDDTIYFDFSINLDASREVSIKGNDEFITKLEKEY